MAVMMSSRGWLLVAMLLPAACGGAQGHGAPGFRPGWYAVQFANARLDARRPDGSPWHTSAGDSTALLLGGLIGLAAGNPALGMAVGDAASDPGGDPLAPAPFIDLKIEGETFRVSPVGRTYAPAWNQPIAIDARRRGGNEHVIVQIRDGVNDSAVAQLEMTLGDLLASRTQTFTALGSVMSLDVVVTPMPARQPVVYELAVPSTMRIEALVEQGAPGWQAIPVWNGDVVTIEADGAVCPSSPRECFDPDGAEPGRWRGYSYEGYQDAPHASLVAAAPGERLPIGHARTFPVAQSGRVLLFVNDTDVGNNTGAFDVRVTVMPPR
jgi:hypothetical protein